MTCPAISLSVCVWVRFDLHASMSSLSYPRSRCKRTRELECIKDVCLARHRQRECFYSNQSCHRPCPHFGFPIDSHSLSCHFQFLPAENPSSGPRRPTRLSGFNTGVFEKCECTHSCMMSVCSGLFPASGDKSRQQ